MARTQYTVTFPAAKAGDQVTWPTTVKVYPDRDAQVPLQPGQSLSEALSFSGVTCQPDWQQPNADLLGSRPADDPARLASRHLSHNPC